MAALLDEGKPATTLLTGDCCEMLASLPAGIVQTCVTSPPYWGLRDYGVDGQLGAEDFPQAYVENLVKVFAAVMRVLRDDGTLWLNLGDTYATVGGGRTYGSADGCTGRASAPGAPRKPPPGIRSKNLIGIPWRAAFALQEDGWYLRSDIIWEKPNAMPESVKDRPTRCHEYLFLLTKSPKYYYDADAVAEPAVSKHGSGNGYRRPERLSYQDASGARGSDTPWTPRATRNRRDVWHINTQPFKGAHFATFPPQLPEICILAGSQPGDTVLDPFLGAGTTGLVAAQQGRGFIGIDNNPAYVEMARQRILGIQ